MEFEYKPSFTRIVFLGLLHGSLATFFWWLAGSNHQGLRLFRLVTFNAETASIIYGFAAFFFFGALLYTGALLFQRLFVKQQLLIDANRISVPTGIMQPKSKSLLIHEVSSITLRKSYFERVLTFVGKGERGNLEVCESHLPRGAQDLEEILSLFRPE